jgi:hypothetical protein
MSLLVDDEIERRQRLRWAQFGGGGLCALICLTLYWFQFDLVPLVALAATTSRVSSVL